MRRLLLALGLLLAAFGGAEAASTAQKCASYLCVQPRPVLDLDFINGGGVLPPIVTFSRASSATYFNSAGLLATASSGAPRFDYNPSTLALAGLLIEEARTNLLLQSNNIANAAWGNVGGVITANQATSPDGTVDATKMQTTAATAAFGQFQNATYTAAAYTFSMFAKAGTYNFAALDFQNSANAGAVFDLSNGTIGFTDVGVTSAIASVGNGWYRLAITKTLTAVAGLPEVYFSGSRTANTRSWTAAGTETLFVYGGDLEAGAFPTSYIPTTTATVTRAADVATVATSAFAWNAAAGSVALQAFVSAVNASGSARFIGDASSAQELLGANSSLPTAMGMFDGTHFMITGNAAPANAAFKAASSYSSSGQSIVLNGGTVVTSANAFAPTATTLSLGNGQTGAGPIGQAWFQRIRYFNQRLPNAQLQALTR